VQAIKIDRVVVARRMQDHAVRRRACLFVADIGVAHGGTNGNAISRLCTMPQNSPPRLNYGSYRVATYACYSMPRTTRVKSKCTLSIESAGNSSFIARARPGPLALVMRVFQDLYVRLVSPCLSAAAWGRVHISWWARRQAKPRHFHPPATALGVFSPGMRRLDVGAVARSSEEWHASSLSIASKGNKCEFRTDRRDLGRASASPP
jgi:hypothetical protein